MEVIQKPTASSQVLDNKATGNVSKVAKKFGALKTIGSGINGIIGLGKKSEDGIEKNLIGAMDLASNIMATLQLSLAGLRFGADKVLKDPVGTLKSIGKSIGTIVDTTKIIKTMPGAVPKALEKLKIDDVLALLQINADALATKAKLIDETIAKVQKGVTALSIPNDAVLFTLKAARDAIEKKHNQILDALVKRLEAVEKEIATETISNAAETKWDERNDELIALIDGKQKEAVAIEEQTSRVDEFLQAYVGILGQIKSAFDKVAPTLSGVINPTIDLEKALASISSALQPINKLVGDILDFLKPLTNPLQSVIDKITQPILDALDPKGQIGTLKSYLESEVQKSLTAIGGVFDQVTAFIENAEKAIQLLVKEALTPIEDYVKSLSRLDVTSLISLGDSDANDLKDKRIIMGGDKDDTITAVVNASSYLFGEAGADTITGSSADDLIIGGLGDDTLVGGGGSDILLGNAGNDILHGDAGADILVAGIGADQLRGGIGIDELDGGVDKDKDLFVGTLDELDGDVILNFNAGLDQIKVLGGVSRVSVGPDPDGTLVEIDGKAFLVKEVLNSFGIVTDGSDALIDLDFIAPTPPSPPPAAPSSPPVNNPSSQSGGGLSNPQLGQSTAPIAEIVTAPNSDTPNLFEIKDTGNSKSFVGGTGDDTVTIPVDLEETSLTTIDGGFRLTTKDGITFELTSIETLEFNNATLTLSTDPLHAQLSLLYDAVLGRSADFGGLGHWIDQLDAGATFIDIANAIFASEEFRQKSGINPSNDALIDLAYTQFLGRDADEPGRAFWSDYLANPQNDVGVFWANFVSSEEAKLLFDNQIDDGVFYLT